MSTHSHLSPGSFTRLFLFYRLQWTYLAVRLSFSFYSSRLNMSFKKMSCYLIGGTLNFLVLLIWEIESLVSVFLEGSIQVLYLSFNTKNCPQLSIKIYGFSCLRYFSFFYYYTSWRHQVLVKPYFYCWLKLNFLLTEVIKCLLMLPNHFLKKHSVVFEVLQFVFWVLNLPLLNFNLFSLTHVFTLSDLLWFI